ncbi:PREDICTED: uncharacterized protein LOC109242560 [Nicotiana attenuata]|uniref:uncharacterized protein LOC109242560 n=1 Tax=Nicotiana attenuata TaxID=49451 RepID=UPI0009047D97|nr:PREDICTED: uncharacterized protein LOC109242560 [Nicotiana attenuata]
MGHRCFLPLDHPWRKNRRLFDGKVEKGVAPNPLTGDDVLMQLQGLGNVTFGKGQKRKRNAPNNAYNWKKKRWEQCVVTSSMLRIISRREAECNFLANLKVPDAFSSNISRCVKVEEKKIHGLKSHDHHVLLEDIFPLAIYGVLPKEVSEPTIEIGKFFKNLCSKCLTIEDLDILEAEIAITLCKFQMVFPPAFFDVMVHLPIHLAREAKLGGPVQYRWMYPFERYLRILKSYVRNYARPEGSIAEGYLAEESLTFCSRYLKNISTKFNRPARNDGESVSHGEISIFKNSGWTKGGSDPAPLSRDELNQATIYVLQNCEEVWPFLEEHTREMEIQSAIGDGRHNNDFFDWFRAHILQLSAQGHANDDLISLALGPGPLVLRYSTLMVNGFRFQTRDIEWRRKTQNCGVLVRGDDSDSTKEYYGIMEDIYKLSYVGNKKVYLFRCHWWDVAHVGKGYKIDKYGFTSVNTRCALNTYEPFVLAPQCEQVFYVDDMSNKDWLVVVKTNPRDLFNMPEKDINSTEIEDEVLSSEDAYQQEQVEINTSRIHAQEIDIVVSLYRDDVEPQIIYYNQATEAQTTVHNEDDGFINDDDMDLYNSEQSDEELLDDNDGEDTDIDDRDME